MSKPPLHDPNPLADIDALPPRTVRRFRAPATPAENVAAYRRKRLQLRVIVVLFVVWVFGLGGIENTLQERGARRRQVEVDTLLATTQGIPVSLQGQILLCDAACYKELTGRKGNVDILNAALLSSSKRGPSPPELNSLILEVDEDQDNYVAMILGFLLLAALLSPLILWQDPLRILLLRPFAEGPASRSLRKFVRKNVTGWGHVVTLSDSYINESVVRNSTIYSFSPRRLIGQAFAIPLFPLVRLPPLIITAHKEAHLPRVLAALNNRYNLNYYSIFDIIRKVRSSNALWQRVVLLLMSNADLIRVGLPCSAGASNALWQRVVLLLMSNAEFIPVDLTVVKKSSGS